MPNDAQDRAAEWLSAGSASCDEGHRTFVAALQHKLETASWKRGNRRQQELAAWAFPDRAGSRPGGVQWLPKWAPESKGSTPESSNKLLLLLCYLGLTWWIPRGVASQKNRSVAGEVPRCAPQHTAAARRDPQNYAETPCSTLAGGADRPAHASREDIPFVGHQDVSVNPSRCLSENFLT
jgi:hypothetical protein